MQVIRYFHIRDALGASKGGATVMVTGDTDQAGYVAIRSVECSAQDNYNKKAGRSLAEKAMSRAIPLRSLPVELRAISERACKHKRISVDPSDTFEYAIKYFLPME